MSEYIQKWMDRKEVIECYELVKEWEMWIDHRHIGSTKVKVRIHLGNDGRYFFTTSHGYKGSDQAGAYISSDISGETIEEALRKAKRQLFSFFNEDDQGAEWVELE